MKSREKLIIDIISTQARIIELLEASNGKESKKEK